MTVRSASSGRLYRPRRSAVPPKVREMIKLIQADGWYVVSQRGSHRQYKHPTKPGRGSAARIGDRLTPIRAADPEGLPRHSAFVL
jgi:hypothetical protein